MNEVINISPVVADNNTRRLNYIPGRTLSEQEFDLMQVYVDERCEDLLVSQQPGIVEGLDLVLPVLESDEVLSELLTEEVVQINPGVGLSYSGKVITNRLPIRFYWQDLINQYLAEQKLLNTVEDGIYFLTLRRSILVFEEAQRQEPNTRTELNPLRDTRLETLAQVSLQHIWYVEDLFDQSRQRIAVSVLQTLIKTNAFADNPDQIKLALVKIKDQKAEWIDNLAGRFLARENPVHFTLMEYWHSILASPSRFRLEGDAVEIDTAKNLKTLLDIDCLPAAGKFPENLITNLAGKEKAKTWGRPELQFNPDGLQIEILPIPENSVQGIMENEVARGVIDLNPGSLDRFRILIAVNQQDYHPKLMDLPEIDLELINKYLVEKQQEAATAYQQWESAYYDLYGGLRKNIALNDEKNKKKVFEDFSSIYLTHVTQNAFSKIPVRGTRPEVPAIADTDKKSLGIPLQSVAPPETVHKALDDIAKGKTSRPYKLVEAYKEKYQIAAGTTVTPADDRDGKIHQRIQLKDQIAALEELAITTNMLIDDVRDYLGSCRQKLDSITLSFSSLAGGIPGDGTGLKLMRWSDKLIYKPKV